MCQAIDILEMYVIEVERQLGEEFKVMRSDLGGEYYDKYNELGQDPGPFFKFLENNGISAQYSMPGMPK